MPLTRSHVVVFLLVLAAGASAHAGTGTINGTIPAHSDAQTIAGIWGLNWGADGLICEVTDRNLTLYPGDPLLGEFVLNVNVSAGVQTTVPHSYQLTATWDDTKGEFTFVELTIDAQTETLETPTVSFFPEIDVASTRVRFRRGIPALGRWTVVGTVAGLVLLGAALVVRRGL